MRLHTLLRNSNGDGLSAGQYRALKRRFPLVVLNKDGDPDFRDKPTTREQAIRWLNNKRLCEKYEEDHSLNDLPRTLVLIRKGEKNVSIEEFLIQKFSIKPSDL